MEADPANLNSALGIGEVDAAELSCLLLLHFRYSHGGPSGEVLFQRQAAPCAVKLIFRGSELLSVLGGPGLQQEDIPALRDKVRRELIDSPGATPARCILFSNHRVTGCFSCGDKLRVFPVPGYAPRAPDLSEQEYCSDNPTIQHPFVVGFPIKRSASPFIEIMRLKRETQKYALLLNVFLEGGVSCPPCGRRRHWVHDGPLDSPSKYLQEDYRYPGFADIGPDLSSPEHFSPMETMEYYEYFAASRQGLNLAMRVPKLLTTFLERFWSLSKTEQHRFLKSAFWLRHASTVWLESKSAAYLAIIICVETLLPPRSNKSKDRHAKSRTAQFLEFLSKNAPDSAPDASERRRLYELRSDLAHGWDLFHADSEPPFCGINPKSSSESYSHFLVERSARAALLNWLMTQTGGWASSD